MKILLRIGAAHICIIVRIFVLLSTGSPSTAPFLTELDLVLNRFHLIGESVGCLGRAVLLLTVLLQVLGPGQEESIVVALRFQVIVMDIPQLTLQDEVTGRAAVKERLCITRVRTNATVNHGIWLVYNCVPRLTPLGSGALLVTARVSRFVGVFVAAAVILLGDLAVISCVATCPIFAAW